MVGIFAKRKAAKQNALQDVALQVLRDVLDPFSGQDIVSLGMVNGVQVDAEGRAVFAIEVAAERAADLEAMRAEAEKAVARIDGIKKVTAVLTAEAEPPKRTPKTPHEMPKVEENALPIRKIIAVASGKGGVGKSTLAANLAVALARSGQKVGLLDADIYGPSQPRMMGLSGQKPGGEKGAIIPLEAHGVKVMSIGFMVEEDSALIWRGPMAQSAMMQLLTDVEWGTTEEPLDVLLIDMPPGTGDIALSLSQKVPVSGAIIVSTPQDIALLDARKGIAMFQKVDVPILGVIENMSTHICTNCGHEEHIFGHGGAKAEAEKLGVPFLGEVPLSMPIRQAADDGQIQELDIFAGIAKNILT